MPKPAKYYETSDFQCKELSESTLRLLTRQLQTAIIACEADIWIELKNVPDRIRNPDGDVLYWQVVSPRKSSDRLVDPAVGMAAEKCSAPAGERYFLDKDSDNHWYLIPVTKRAEWETWLALDPDSLTAAKLPDFVRLVGHVDLLTFVDPQEP